MHPCACVLRSNAPWCGACTPALASCAAMQTDGRLGVGCCAPGGEAGGRQLKGASGRGASLGGSACGGMAADAAVARAQMPRQADQRLRPAPPWRRPGRRRTARSRSGPSPTPPCSTRPTCAWRACQPPWPGCSTPRSAPLGRSPRCAPCRCATRIPPYAFTVAASDAPVTPAPTSLTRSPARNRATSRAPSAARAPIGWAGTRPRCSARSTATRL